MTSSRILWVAVADGRGHLMRAHLARCILEARGIRVDVATTSEQGCRFLAALGTPSALISRRYGLVYDERHNLVQSACRAHVARYLASPRRALRDLDRLEELAAGADLVMNDFHPAPLVAPLAPAARRLRIVHVYGTGLWSALEHSADHRVPRPIAAGVARALGSLRARSFACIEHGLHGVAPGSTSPFLTRPIRLAPLVAAPSRSRAEVRAELGVRPGQRLAAAYLNPYFRDPAIADEIMRGLRSLDMVVHAVAEGYAGRPGWHALDPRFVDVVGAADVLVSGSGAAASGQAALFGVPLLALVTEQPEQRDNLARLRAMPGARARGVDVGHGAPDLGERIRAAAEALVADPAPRALEPEDVAASVHEAWGSVLSALVVRARLEPATVRRSA